MLRHENMNNVEYWWIKMIKLFGLDHKDQIKMNNYSKKINIKYWIKICKNDQKWPLFNIMWHFLTGEIFLDVGCRALSPAFNLYEIQPRLTFFSIMTRNSSKSRTLFPSRSASLIMSDKNKTKAKLKCHWSCLIRIRQRPS